MRYYISYRTYYESPIHKYFDTLEEMSQYLEETITEEDCNKGYTIEKNGNFWLICKKTELTY